MKFFHITAVAALAASAAAQGLMSDLPSCAKECVANALPKDCGLDIGCICKTKSFINKMACCVEPACDMADQKKTIEVAKKICKTGGVTDIPNSVHCDKGSSTGGESSSSTTATGSEATGNTTMTQTTASGSSTASGTTSTSASAAASTTTNAAVFGQSKDSSLMAAAGAAAAFAILV
ncbi:hypothetical protein N7474_003925 [Penicillium riverlandense]|uniref:uncharacterized protein n=1 Tax=Penicillium riverlandense TaxID=1903569 RepID=UPI0025498C3D|nr:uncharacterized protein N7474_003925 [Penicillium riverlandense]KAJ5818334.1 hypothetical protein N7474_003925 [Penicillium riverlandense]